MLFYDHAKPDCLNPVVVARLLAISPTERASGSGRFYF